MREFLARRKFEATPPSITSSVGPDYQAGEARPGAGEYISSSPNFAPTKFTGLYKTLYQAPDQPTLRFPRRPPACYDVLEMRPLDVKTDGDWMTLQADMRSLPGKIFAFLPSAIDKVSLKATATLAAGTDLDFQASVANAAGETIDAAFPLEITLLDPSMPRLACMYSVRPARCFSPRGVFRSTVKLASGNCGSANSSAAP